MILARSGLSFRELPVEEFRTSEVRPPRCGWSVVIFLCDAEIGTFKPTGVYFPPKAVITLERVKGLTEPSGMMRTREATIGRLVVGDPDHMG